MNVQQAIDSSALSNLRARVSVLEADLHELRDLFKQYAQENDLSCYAEEIIRMTRAMRDWSEYINNLLNL